MPMHAEQHNTAGAKRKPAKANSRPPAGAGQTAACSDQTYGIIDTALHLAHAGGPDMSG